MNRVKVVIIGIAFLLNSFNAAAVCEEHLQRGLTATEYSRQSSYVRMLVDSFLSSATYDQAKEKFGADFVVDAIPVTANYDSFKSYQQMLKQMSLSETIVRHEEDVVKSFGDPQLVSAYLACLAYNGGIVARFIEQDDPMFARLEITYYARPTAPDTVFIKDATQMDKLNGVQVISGRDCFQVGAELARGVTCPVELQLDSAVRSVPFSIRTAEGSSSAFLPPRMELRSGQENLPRKYVTAENQVVTALEVVAPNGDHVSGEACTAELPPGHFIIVSPTNPVAHMSSKPGFPQDNGSTRVTTSPGITQQVCFWGQCGNSSGSRAECLYWLEGTMKYRKWVPRGDRS